MVLALSFISLIAAMTASAIDEAFASAWSVRHTMIVIFIFAFIADFLKCECQHSSLWPKLFYDG